MTSTSIISVVVSPKQAPSIEATYFDNYYNPSTLRIKVKNPDPFNIDITIPIWVDTYDTTNPPRITINDTIGANEVKIVEVPTSQLNLTTGRHSVYCEIQST